MQDEMLGRLWAAHHDELSLSIGRGLVRLRQSLARIARWDGSTARLGAMAAAFAITSLGLITTAATPA